MSVPICGVSKYIIDVTFNVLCSSVACVIEEEVLDETMSGKDVEALPLYNVRPVSYTYLTLPTKRIV